MRVLWLPCIVHRVENRYLTLISRKNLTWRSPALRGFIAQRPVDRRVMP